MLVIFPDDCIDCGVCVPECPVDAIAGAISEGDDLTDDARYWLDINTKYSVIWPEITSKGQAPADAEKWKNVQDKKMYFSPDPGTGDER